MFFIPKNIIFLKRTCFYRVCVYTRNMCSLELNMSSPLHGVSVLDMTRIVAGPYCTMMLGDLGAQVIKVENPRGGDEARKWGPPFINNSDETCYFACLNRNKKSVCIDLKSPEGVSVVHDLAKKCDVLVENYIPGKLDELGLGYNQLREIAPQLVYCSITGYGPDGPYAKRPGYDVIAAGFGGLLGFTGEENGGPVKVGVAVTDIATGLHAYGSIIAALFMRQRTGMGQMINCSLLATQVASLINLGSNYLNAGVLPVRRGTAHESIVPYQAFSTKDGHLIIGAGSDVQFKALCQILDIADLAMDERFAVNNKRVQNRKQLIDILENILKSKSTEDWMTIFEGVPFPYGPVNTLKEVFSDAQVEHMGLVKEMPHPVVGAIKVVGPPVKFSDGGNCVRTRPPLLAEHTDAVLLDFLGYSENKIQALKASNAVF